MDVPRKMYNDFEIAVDVDGADVFSFIRCGVTSTLLQEYNTIDIH